MPTQCAIKPIEVQPVFLVDQKKDRSKYKGVNIEVISPGDGISYPTKGDEIALHYIGRLKDCDKTVFSTTVYDDSPFSFKLGFGTTIKGWELVLPKMSLGEISLVQVAASLAYGAHGTVNGDIEKGVPPNSDLDFEIELIAINKNFKKGYEKGKTMLSFPPRPGKWTTSLFECWKNLDSCCLGFFCPGLLFAFSAESIGGGSDFFEENVAKGCGLHFLYCCVPRSCWVKFPQLNDEHETLRKRIRERFELPETPFSDHFIARYCFCFGVCQEARELKARLGK